MHLVPPLLGCTELGTRGSAANELLVRDESLSFEGAEFPFVKAVTVQHIAQAYASERVNVSLGAVRQGSNGLSGE